VALSPRLLEALLRRLWTERLGLDRALAGAAVFRVGERIADEGVTLLDDPGAARSFKGAPTDDEGVPGEARAVLSRGVVTTLLADRRSAAEARTASTGNGFRVPFINEDRADAPIRVALGHLSLEPGPVPRVELLRGATLWVPSLLGLHSANRSTGAFNSPILGGLALENGLPVARLKPGAWSLQGNAFGLLRGLGGLSREREHTGSAELPCVVATLRAG
jgi:predicted Zn-dependent protease